MRAFYLYAVTAQYCVVQNSPIWYMYVPMYIHSYVQYTNCNIPSPGKLGHVRVMRITSRDGSAPSLAYLRSSGKAGIFVDCIIHDFDMMTWTLGELPDEVSVHE